MTAWLPSLLMYGLTPLVGLVLLVWLFGNLSPARRDCFNHRLEAQEAEQETGQKAKQDNQTQGQIGLSSPPRLPKAVILCPGRNEDSWITMTLPELCQQDYPDYQVVFIDDHSDDTTPSITASMTRRYAHLTVVRSEIEPPSGWVGKCWAIHQGYRELQLQEGANPAQWVCFTDADIRWHPLCLQAAMRHGMKHDADLVALFPKLEFGSAVEVLGQLTMVLALGMLFPFKKAMDPKNPNTLTGGAFMLVRRSVYDKIGGHQAVASCVVEDLNLGRKLKAAGAKIRIAVTPDLLRCRMYEGWCDMWEGLTKNAYAGLEYRLSWAVGFLATAWLVNVFAPFYLIASTVWAWHEGSVLAWGCLAMSVAVLLLQARTMNGVRKLLGLKWWWAWSVPAGTALYSLFIVASIWRYYFGGNVWKGRSYSKANLDQPVG